MKQIVFFWLVANFHAWLVAAREKNNGRFVGYKDIYYSYPLSDEVCAKVNCQDGGGGGGIPRDRATAMRIYYPTQQAEDPEPDNTKDRYFNICNTTDIDGTANRRRLGGVPDNSFAIRILCNSDLPRVTATPNAALSDNGNAQFKVILFSPGKGNVHFHYNSMLQKLVRNHGFVVVALSHPLVDFMVRVRNDKGELHDIAENAQLAVHKQLLLEAGDASAALDYLQGKHANEELPFDTSRLDLDWVGYLGHSLGGASAMLTSVQDSRVQAVANLDGLFAGPDYDGRNLARELSVPWMLMGSTFSWPFLFATGYQAWTTNIPAGGSVASRVKNAGHLSFSDICHSDLWPSATEKWPYCFGVNPDHMLFMVLRYTAAFFRLHLRGDDTATAILRSRSPLFGAHYYK